MMDEFIKVLLSLSFSGTLLTLLILLLKQFYQNRFSKCWQYYIWLAAALRFLVPFTPDAAVAGSFITTLEASLINTSARTAPDENVFHAAQEPIAATDSDSPNSSDTLTISQKPSVTVYTVLAFIWAAFVLVFLIRKITLYQSFVQYVRAGNTEVSDIDTLNLLSGVQEKLHINRTIGLYSNPMIGSPVMIGLFHPAILLPDGQLPKEDLVFIFSHELIHYKRCDMLYKWFIQLVICIHWFNPFAWLLGKEVNKACELSCDEAVIAPLDDKAKHTYGTILLSCVKTDKTYKNSLASVTLTEGAQQLKERLGSIMKYQKKPKSITAAAVILTALILVCSNTLGAYAKPADDAASDQPSSYTYTYMQRGFYQDSYIIEMGWNLNERQTSPYPSRSEISLKDGAKMTLYFADTAQEYANNADVLSAITGLVNSLKTKTTYPALETPLIVSITPVSSTKLPDMAQEYFSENDVMRFSALFKALNPSLQAQYLQKIYDADKIALFSSVIEHMDREVLLQYAEQCSQDNNISFFSVILDKLPSEDLQRYAEKYYEENNISFFSVLTGKMSEEQKQNWLARALKDNKNTFYWILANELEEFVSYPTY